jgi:FkbH-like protein
MQERSELERDKLLIVSDFNADILAGLLANDTNAPAVAASSAGFRQVTSALLNDDPGLWRNKKAALIWVRPEAISEVFAKAKLMQPVDHSDALREMDTFCDAIIAASSRVPTTLVATLHLPEEERGYGALDMQAGLGVRSLLARMNQRLAERLNATKGLFLLDATRWFACKNAINHKMWYLAKVPYSNDVFKAAIGDLKAALRAVRGQTRKVVICDLDDTLWGGIVGDVGWENLRLGGHDPVGEALVDFQRELRALTQRGIILGIVSKNTESVALEAIEKHPEMVLRQSDFAGWRINWNDKAQNIADLMKELNLGLDSAVFLDDNPVERARVAEALPELLVPDLPSDKMLYVSALRRLDCFDSAAVSNEDRNRAAYYSAERERRTALEGADKVASLDDWLLTLQIKVQAEPINDVNRKRAGQLFNKTNQLNLTTRRMTENELESWADAGNRVLLTFRVSDKFGEAGLTGIAGVELVGDEALVTDYVLSCRVMGKRVEEAIVHQLTESARSLGAKKLKAIYKPTAKNQPCLEFWRNSGFEYDNDNTFVWDLDKAYPKPAAIELIVSKN